MFIKCGTRIIRCGSLDRIGTNAYKTSVGYEVDYITEGGTSEIIHYTMADNLTPTMATELLEAIWDAIEKDDNFDIDEWIKEH